MTPLLAHGLRADRSFERLYQRHVGDVYRYALAVLRNPSDAEDVTQTTFLNAYRALQQGERPRQPHNWLIAIAHNVCRQRFRQATRRVHEVELDDNQGDWLEDDERGPTADDLRRALSHLAFNQRAALVMRELEDRSYAEIAKILGVSVSAVETLIFRARRALREQLAGSLTCAEAERALSLEADGRLSRAERGPLRAHLRECKACATIARSQRAQRRAFKALGALPLPSSLASLLGGGGAAIGTKAAAVVATGLVAGGLGLAGERQLAGHPAKAKPRGAPVHTIAPVSALAPARPAPAGFAAHGRRPAHAGSKPHKVRAGPPASVVARDHGSAAPKKFPPDRAKHKSRRVRQEEAANPHHGRHGGSPPPGRAKRHTAEPAAAGGQAPGLVPPGQAKKGSDQTPLQAPTIQPPTVTLPDLKVAPPGLLKPKKGGASFP